MQRTYCVFNQTGESFLGLSVTRADTPLVRSRGLLGQVRIKSGEGLWVARCRGLHPIGLLFPIDLVYLDAENRVIDLVEDFSPFRVTPIHCQSSSVLQLPPHTIYSSQTHIGDQLVLCAPEEMRGYLKRNRT